MHIQRTFAPEGQSVSQARAFVRRTLEEWGAEGITDEVVLAASELVTNAVVHAGTPVRVALERDAQGLRLEVQDLHPHRMLPLAPEDPADDAEHGRGLLITAALAGSWGVEYATGTKRVWLRFELAGAPVVTVDGAAPPLDRIGVAVLGLSPDGEVLSCNTDAERMFGWSAADIVGSSWQQHLVEQDEHPTGGRLGPDSSAGPRWQGVCAVRRGSGASAQAFASRVSLGPGKGAVVLLVPVEGRAILEWPAPRRPAATDVGDPLELRAHAMDRLGFQAYLELVVERARDRLGAQVAYLILSRDLDADFEVAAVSGADGVVRGARLEPGTTGTPDTRNPHLPVVVNDLDGTEVAWLHVAGLRSLVVVPVVTDGRVIGALGVASDHPSDFSDEQAALLHRIGTAAASAVDRARLRASERERRGWLTLLAESGDLLAGSLDQDMTLAITGQIVVPRLASWCALYLDDARGHPVLQQVWHRDERETGALRRRLERAPTGGTAGQADPAVVGGALDIPLVTRGRRIGVLTLGRETGDAPHGEARVVAESVARRAALAIDNARVHGELQALGDALQRGLLPASIPPTSMFDVGVVYRAAGEGLLAGGDFYDLFPVGGGRWVFAVGDVCGTGAEAAAVTGLARHTIRALALAGFPVASILERLNSAILDEGERARFLTVSCGLLERVDGRLRLGLVNAGHPLPFLVRHGSGVVEQLGRPQSLLGVVSKVVFVTDEVLLDRDDLLVAVTDGVLERRDGPRMLAEEGLAAELAEVAGLPAQAVAERVRRLVADFASSPESDDMAVLALRVGPG